MATTMFNNQLLWLPWLLNKKVGKNQSIKINKEQRPWKSREYVRYEDPERN